MSINESPLDRAIRGVVAVVAAIAAFLIPDTTSVLGYILIAVAVIMGITAIVGFCPLYKIFGISTALRTK